MNQDEVREELKQLGFERGSELWNAAYVVLVAPQFGYDPQKVAFFTKVPWEDVLLIIQRLRKATLWGCYGGGHNFRELCIQALIGAGRLEMGVR